MYYTDNVSMHTENNIISVILIEDPTVIARRVSFVDLMRRICNNGSTVVSCDPVNCCSARVTMHPRKYQCENTVMHARMQINKRSGRLDGYKKNIITHERINTG